MKLWKRAQAEQAAGAYQAGSLFPGTLDPVPTAPDTIAGHDANFDVEKFGAWAATVYAMATAAWGANNAMVLRPVMADTVYEPYASMIALLRIFPVLQRYMASATAAATVAAAHGDERYDTVVVRFVATLTAKIDPRLDTGGSHTWTEDWTFQRPSGWTTHSSGAIAVCPNCGAPASPDESGACKYCKADISSRTAGWLVTRTTTTLSSIVKAHAALDRQRQAALARPTPFAPVGGDFEPPPQPPRAE